MSCDVMAKLSTEAQILKSYYSNAAPFYKSLFANNRPKMVSAQSADCGPLCPEDETLVMPARTLTFSPDSEKLKSSTVQHSGGVNASALKQRRRKRTSIKRGEMKGSGKTTKRRKATHKRKQAKVTKKKSRRKQKSSTKRKKRSI